MPYTLSITYDNQNNFVLLIACEETTHELKLAELRFFKNYLNCKSIDDIIHNIETGYHIHVKEISIDNANIVNEYLTEYYDEDKEMAIIDTNFTDDLPENYNETNAMKILNIILEN
jgi:hypothetical protein